MRRYYIYILTAFLAWVGMSAQAQDVHRIPTKPITAQITADTATTANDSVGADSLETKIWDNMPFVRIHQDPYIKLLAEGRYLRYNPNAKSSNVGERRLKPGKPVQNPMGYRLEIYQSNDQRQGAVESDRIRAALTGKVTVPIYRDFYPPFWRVRIGDFRTLEEANEYKRSFIQRFPGMSHQTYAVRCYIKAVVVVRPKEKIEKK